MSRREDDRQRAAAELPPDDASPSVLGMHGPIFREQAEPQDGREPVPMAWLMLIIGLAMWSGWYMGRRSGDFDPRRYDGSVEEMVAGAGVAPPPLDLKVVGRRAYNSCMACHQADGRGVAGQFPPLAGSEWVLGDERVLVRILLQGLQHPIEVMGQTYNGVMPAWQQSMSDTQIAGVLTYIRGNWGNDAAQVDPEAIAAGRLQTAGRTSPWRAEELRALPAAP